MFSFTPLKKKKKKIISYTTVTKRKKIGKKEHWQIVSVAIFNDMMFKVNLLENFFGKMSAWCCAINFQFLQMNTERH